MIEDKEILLLLKSDKRGGLKILFREYSRPLILYALQYVADIQRAEDIVQDLFVRLWEEEYLDKYVPGSLKAYLFTSVRNACYTAKTKKDLLRDSIEVALIEVEADAAMTMNQQIVDRITVSINAQPLQTRLVLDCVLMQDMKYNETAEKLKISVNTVKTLLKIGMRALREEFKDTENLFLLFLTTKKVESIHPF